MDDPGELKYYMCLQCLQDYHNTHMSVQEEGWKAGMDKIGRGAQGPAASADLSLFPGYHIFR